MVVFHAMQKQILKVGFPNTSVLSSSSRRRLLNDSMYAFSHGLPGAMYNVPTPDFFSHFRIVSATNSGPLSLRRYCGVPRTANRYSSVLRTASAWILRSTSIVRVFHVRESQDESVEV